MSLRNVIASAALLVLNPQSGHSEQLGQSQISAAEKICATVQPVSTLSTSCEKFSAIEKPFLAGSQTAIAELSNLQPRRTAFQVKCDQMKADIDLMHHRNEQEWKACLNSVRALDKEIEVQTIIINGNRDTLREAIQPYAALVTGILEPPSNQNNKAVAVKADPVSAPPLVRTETAVPKEAADIKETTERKVADATDTPRYTPEVARRPHKAIHIKRQSTDPDKLLFY